MKPLMAITGLRKKRHAKISEQSLPIFHLQILPVSDMFEI